MTDDESRREREQRWCAGPAIVDGHRLPCRFLDRHEGDCVPSTRTLTNHFQRGRVACERNGCER